MAEQSPPAPKEIILKLLAEYKYLTVKQIWDKSGAAWAGKSLTQTRVELNRLKKAGLVTNCVVETHLGGAAEKQWMLLRPGAATIGIINFDNRYKRTPSPSKVKERALELSLEEQVDLAPGDWKLLKPKIYNSVHRIPKGHTEAFYLLCMAVNWNYYKATGKMPDDLTGFQTLGVPLNPNHYIAYRTGHQASARYAVVFILPPDQAGLRYWNERIRQYNSITEQKGLGQIRIYAVFKNKQEASSYQKLLNKTGIEPINVARIAGILGDIKVD